MCISIETRSSYYGPDYSLDPYGCHHVCMTGIDVSEHVIAVNEHGIAGTSDHQLKAAAAA